MAYHKPLVVLVLIGLLVVGSVGPVAAHETQNVDGYDVTFGGADEPLITDERMWLEFELVDNETGEPVEGQADALSASVQIEGQERSEVNLTEKHGEDGVYEAPVIFTEPGEYVVHLEGSIDDTEVHTHFETEVHDHTDLEYPSDDSRAANDSDEAQADTQTAEAGFGSASVAIAAIAIVGAISTFLFRWR